MGLLKTAARAAVASSVHGRVQRRQQQRWAAQDVAQGPPPSQAPAPPVAAPVAESPAIDVQQKVDLLRQLGELRDSGVISDEEFEAKKAEVWG